MHGIKSKRNLPEETLEVVENVLSENDWRWDIENCVITSGCKYKDIVERKGKYDEKEKQDHIKPDPSDKLNGFI
jgi:hypothetical protein